MAQQPVSGVYTAAKYDFESTFNAGGTPQYPFGYELKIRVSRNNNLERIYGIGGRNAQYTIAKRFEGKMTIDFVLGNAYWLKSVIGAQGAAGGGGPYTHAFTEANAPPSLTIAACTELGTNDMVTTFTGVIIVSAKIVLNENEAIRVSLECLYATESTATTGVFSAVADTYCEPMTFAYGSITYAGQTMGLVYSGIPKSVTLTINNNSEMIFGIGSRLAQERLNKIREYNLSMSYALVSVANAADVFPNMLGDTSAPFTPGSGNPTGANMVLTISNGLSTTSLRSLVFTFTAAKTFFNTSDMSFDVNDPLKDDVEGWAESISTLVYTDNTNSGIGA